MNREAAIAVTVGTPIWRYKATYPKVPAVVTSVSAHGFSSKRSVTSNEKATFHRIGQFGVNGVSLMSATDIERISDLERWDALKFIRSGSGGIGSRALAVTVFVLREHPDFVIRNGYTISDIAQLRRELDVAEELLTREAARCE
jgi:hypothetical protein